jgi:hypothetical protein
MAAGAPARDDDVGVHAPAPRVSAWRSRPRCTSRSTRSA